MVATIRLTPRQLQFVRLVALGRSQGQIASAMGISAQAVKHLAERIADRLPGEGGPMRRVRLYARELLSSPPNVPRESPP